jgi:hypothetical protein
VIGGQGLLCGGAHRYPGNAAFTQRELPRGCSRIPRRGIISPGRVSPSLPLSVELLRPLFRRKWKILAGKLGGVARGGGGGGGGSPSNVKGILFSGGIVRAAGRSASQMSPFVEVVVERWRKKKKKKKKKKKGRRNVTAGGCGSWPARRPRPIHSSAGWTRTAGAEVPRFDFPACNYGIDRTSVAELNQTLYYLIGNSIIRLVVIDYLSPQTVKRIGSMRPLPSYYAIYASTKQMEEFFRTVRPSPLPSSICA